MNSASNPQFARVFAIYFHGEQLIPIFLGALLFAIALLVAFSWLLVRYFKPRIGRMAYPLASIPFLLAGVALLTHNTNTPARNLYRREGWTHRTHNEYWVKRVKKPMAEPMTEEGQPTC